MTTFRYRLENAHAFPPAFPCCMFSVWNNSWSNHVIYYNIWMYVYAWNIWWQNEILRYELWCIVLVLSFCSVISAKKEIQCEVFIPCIIKIQLPLKEPCMVDNIIRSSPWLVTYYYNWREFFTVHVQTLWPKRGGTKAMKLSNITQWTPVRMTLLSSLVPGLLAIAFCHLQYC